jgi:hypothetical protein
VEPRVSAHLVEAEIAAATVQRPRPHAPAAFPVGKTLDEFDVASS